MKGQSATILALNLALVQVHGESKFPSSTKQSHRKLIPYIDRTLLSFLDDSFFGRQTVINLLVEEYTNITAKAGCDKIDLLDSAIEAIDFCETDAEPVPITDYDFLFVGSVGASRNHVSIKRDGITHIINWSGTAKCNLFKDIEYLCIEGVSGETAMLNHLGSLDYAVEFIESARKSGGKVLVHCWYGLNRSVTNLVAYLMKYEGMSASDANDLINITRVGADPYFEVLDEYSWMLENLDTQSRTASTVLFIEKEEPTTTTTSTEDATTAVSFSKPSIKKEGTSQPSVAASEVNPLEEQRMELPNDSRVMKSTVLLCSTSILCLLFTW